MIDVVRANRPAPACRPAGKAPPSVDSLTERIDAEVRRLRLSPGHLVATARTLALGELIEPVGRADVSSAARQRIVREAAPELAAALAARGEDRARLGHDDAAAYFAAARELLLLVGDPAGVARAAATAQGWFVRGR